MANRYTSIFDAGGSCAVQRPPCAAVVSCSGVASNLALLTMSPKMLLTGPAETEMLHLKVTCLVLSDGRGEIVEPRSQPPLNDL